jgi:phage tail sheath protein FI
MYTALSTASKDDNYYMNAINGVSNYVTATSGTLAVGTGAMTGGTDGSTLLDADYLNALNQFDIVDTLNLLAIPGVTTTAVLKGILDYCSNRKTFPILDPPKGTDATEAEALVESLSGEGAIYGPWGNVVDPLSTQSNMYRLVPPSGHVMGVYARVDKSRGVYKAPVGTEARVKGFVSLERTFTSGEVKILNPVSFNCILSKPNVGIVVWGARTLSANPKKKYVPVVRLGMMIEESCYQGTQWAVFEPNDEDLWKEVDTTLASYLYTLWLEGALKGETPSQAYYTKCDADLNTTETQDQGKVISEIGYATKKPGEFIIIRMSQDSVVSSDS